METRLQKGTSYYILIMYRSFKTYSFLLKQENQLECIAY